MTPCLTSHNKRLFTSNKKRPPPPSCPQSSRTRSPQPHLHNVGSSIDEEAGDHGVKSTVVRPSQTAVRRRKFSGLKAEPTRRSREHGAPVGVREEDRTKPGVGEGARGAWGAGTRTC